MLHQLTFTRFLAAIAIVIFHYGGSAIPFQTPILKSLFSNANVGVSFFFILSGFVMIIAYGAKQSEINFREYFVNRFARIYPIYFLALIATTSLLFLKSGIFIFKSFFLSTFLLQGWLPDQATCLNIPGWSLSVELLFYLLFPIIFNLVYRKFKTITIATFILVIWLASQYITHKLFYSSFNEGYPSNSHNFIHYFPMMHLNEFLIGNLAGIFYLNIKKKENFDFHLILLITLTFSFILFKDFLDLKINIHNGIMGVFFVPIIILLASNTGRVTSIFSNKHFILLGEISYSIYILQYPIYLVVYYLGKPFQVSFPSLLFYVYFVILILSSFLAYQFIEIPSRRIIKNLLAK